MAFHPCNSNTGSSQCVIYAKPFPRAPASTLTFSNTRQTTNSPFSTLSPTLSSAFRFQFQQELAGGFWLRAEPALSAHRENNKKISDIAFKDQVIATVTQIENIYWDLVERLRADAGERAILYVRAADARQRQKATATGSIPAMDVMRAEAEVSKRDQDLTVAEQVSNCRRR